MAGADAICNGRALAANLPGTYMAWISTGFEWPADRFVHSTDPYILTTGTKVADDWADLSFNGQGSSRLVWTGTNQAMICRTP